MLLPSNNDSRAGVPPHHRGGLNPDELRNWVSASIDLAEREASSSYSGADMERIEPFISMMEAGPPELDAIIVPDWSRFSRSPEGPS